MISQECFRAIEGRLYHYDDMKRQVACFQSDQWRLRAGRTTGMPRGQALRSDPTAQGALALADPPPEIARCIQWIQCIEKALERIAQDSPLLERLVRAYYLNNDAITVRQRTAHICASLDLERSVFYQYRRRIVQTVYLQAVYDPLLEPQ